MLDQFNHVFGLVPGTFEALFSVIVADVVLAADNAVVIGLAASRLPPALRKRAIFYGILGATVLRILFALIAVQLLQIIGLTLAGGVLLLWVGWKFWREVEEDRKARKLRRDNPSAQAPETANHAADPNATQPSGFSAFGKILLADVSMSLENVLAVAGAARDHWVVMMIGLGFSVLLVGGASVAISRILLKYHFLIYIGLAVIIWIALKMIYDGGHEVAKVLWQ